MEGVVRNPGLVVWQALGFYYQRFLETCVMILTTWANIRSDLSQMLSEAAMGSHRISVFGFEV